ncbi:NADH-quinone oxidoreductase subunit J [Alloprevotella sp. OH1205_COT-284]|uniref:NADH-quinone oxidoreductase subunit J family protein n=1 Tax=Alloprevotella sp. OH1205_COT-284 TaxID=2491043 RepID=UPI000F5F40AE|nr:NADH-quinone oxidoreductase subunit J [Alloprevotella sp. OH1205_COT-284]RRD80338.1 NADH-quinone oxidoreductase subunit J [Alloprevotella sp. OH1205_COT-284]
MNAQDIMFVILAVLIVCSSIATVVTKSIVRAATYLLFVLLGTAGLYFLLGYTFLGSVQIMVYAGGIIVLYVFSILLTSGKQERLTENSRLKSLSALLLSLVGLAVVVGIFWAHGFIGAETLTAPSEAATPSMHQIGEHMLSTDRKGYLLPFEAVSVLLLACIVGGLLIARKR